MRGRERIGNRHTHRQTDRQTDRKDTLRDTYTHTHTPTHPRMERGSVMRGRDGDEEMQSADTKEQS